EFGSIPEALVGDKFRIAEDAVNQNMKDHRFDEMTLATTGMTAERLLQRLKQRDSTALELFVKVFRQAFGASPDISTAPNLRAVLTETRAIALSKGKKGVVMFADELTAYLSTRHGEGRIAADILALQN